MKLGVAFAGGGVKGIAHAGVLKALEEENIKIDVFTGTSSGSHVAFLSAIGFNSNMIKDAFDNNINALVGKNEIIDLKSYLLSKYFNFKGLRSGLAIEEFYKKIAKEYGIEKINDIKSSLGIVATDLIKEKEVWFTSKKIEDEHVIKNKINIIDVDIGKAIRASSSYSILFDPCFIDDNVYVDGGAVNNTPIDLAKALGADKVLAVRFEEDKFLEANNLNVINIGLKTLDMMSNTISNKMIEEADIVVTIKSQSNNILDISNSETYFLDGYLAMKNKIKELKKALEFY